MAEQREHRVKVLPEYYEALAAWRKTFEVRRSDRDYRVGDRLVLQEWSPYGGYTGRELTREISYVLDNEGYCKDGYVVLALAVPRAGWPRWISVVDALPEDGELVLAVAKGRYANTRFLGALELAEYDKAYNEWILEAYPELDGVQVTHWMPLPEWPETERGDGREP